MHTAFPSSLPPVVVRRRQPCFAFVFVLSLASTAGAQPAGSPPALVFTPYRETGIYATGERVGWTVTVAPGSADPAGPYGYTMRRDNLAPLGRGRFDLASGSATIEIVPDEPGMVYVEVESVGPPAVRVAALGAAVSPERLAPSAPRPRDFDAFWDGKLKALARVPMEPVVAPMPSGREDVVLETVTVRSLGSRAHAYLARPSTPGRYPALVLLQYAGVYALSPKQAVERAGEGWLVVNVSSHDLPLDQATGVPPNYGAVGHDDRERSYFLEMYLRDVRAIDYVASRPEWNGKTVVVMGTSMGGQQSLVAAALHPKVTALLANEPAGADASGEVHGRRAGYPFWASGLARVRRTGAYFDVVNFAPRIRASALVAVGFIDTITPPVGILTAFNLMCGPKELVPMIESDHNNLTPEKQGAWERRWPEVLAGLRATGRFEPLRPAVRTASH